MLKCNRCGDRGTVPLNSKNSGTMFVCLAVAESFQDLFNINCEPQKLYSWPETEFVSCDVCLEHAKKLLNEFYTDRCRGKGE